MSSSSVSLGDIIALAVKGNALFAKHSYTKGIECIVSAAAQAEQITGSKDNLISAFLMTCRWSAATNHKEKATFSMSKEDRAALNKAVHAEMVAFTASLQRRRAAGTLLRGTWLEVVFYDQCMSPSFASILPPQPLVSGREALPGFLTFLVSALNVLRFAVDIATPQSHASTQLTSAEAQPLFDFVADALDLIGQTVAPDGSPLLFVGPAGAAAQAYPFEAYLVMVVSQHEPLYPLVRGRYPEAMRRFDGAWKRLSSSPVFRVRNFAERTREALTESEQIRAANHVDLQRRVLRCCQLPACGKVEAHPSQFKHCSGCSAAAVVYCCKEHQVADWPSHKAACKAARKGKGGEQQEGGGGAGKQKK